MQQVSRAREHQHVEWKESWRDEYQKWICGFANADGGILEIGRDDRGRVVGVEDAVRLLVDIPNKVRDTLGIMVDVNLPRGERQGIRANRCGGLSKPDQLQR